MNCPHCQSEEKSLIKETRLHKSVVARKRECSSCGRLFSTREEVDMGLKLEENTGKLFKRKTPQREESRFSGAELYSAWGIGK